MLRLWRLEWFERTPPFEEVDFGSDQRVSAADILDGHARQLTTKPTDQPDEQTQYAAQAKTDVHTTIHVVAPKLTPLTDLAEELANTLPDTGPTPYFRDTLNKGLILTHRQHHAQRVLGIRPTETKQGAWRNWLLVSVILTVVCLGLVRLERHR